MIDQSLLSEIEAYCKLNDIEDITVFINKLLRKAFNKEKYSMERKEEAKQEARGAKGVPASMLKRD